MATLQELLDYVDENGTLSDRADVDEIRKMTPGDNYRKILIKKLREQYGRAAYFSTL